MSASTKRAPRGRFSRRPVDRSSSTVTSSPAARYASATWEPTNPAPPLTRTRRVIPRPGLQPEQLLQRLQQAVAVPHARRPFQHDGGLVQELVQERLTELVHLRAIFGREMIEPAQRPLQLRAPQIIEPVAERPDHGDDAQTVVPAPEPIYFLAHDALGRRDLAASLCRRLRRHGLQ